MHYRVKKFGRYVLIFVAWIFCLSLRVGDKTIFDHAHGVLVEKPHRQCYRSGAQRAVAQHWQDSKDCLPAHIWPATERRLTRTCDADNDEASIMTPAQLEIVTWPAPVLETRAEEVTEFR